MAPDDRSRKQFEALLRANGISPTHQRVAIARVLFEGKCHLSADQLLDAVNSRGAKISKATIYNSLKLFVEKQMIRELIVDSAKIYYDSNTAPHHHFYDVDTGELTDFAAENVRVDGIPALPPGTIARGVEIIIRTTNKKAS